MHMTNLRKVGGSVMLAVPPAILDLLKLQAGATVGLSVDGGEMILKPQPKQRLLLETLLAEQDAANELIHQDDAELRAWQNARPVGRELL
jgi:antitoxin ChpS